MGGLTRFVWAFCLSMLVLLGARGAAGDEVFTEIRVCVRDPRLKPTVRVWVYSVNSAEILTTADEHAFRTLSEGKTRFIYDPRAPQSNNIFLPIPYNKLECPEYVLPVKPKPPPPPPEPKKEEDKGDKPAPAAKKEEKKVEAADKPAPKTEPERRPRRERRPEAEAKKPPPEEQEKKQEPILPIVRPSRKPTPMVAACGHCKPKKPGEKPAEEKTAADKVGQEMAITAAILTQNMNEDLRRPDGKKNGMIGGQNPDGIDHPAAQIVASAVLIATAAGIPEFKKKLEEAIRKKTPLMLEIKDLSLEAAEELATKYGAHLADALNKVGAIGPHKLMRKFTAGQGGRWEAHHILEVQRFDKWKHLGDPERAPSVILTKAQHQEITERLRVRTKNVETLDQLWKAYKDVYKKNPQWLQAIQSYFEKGK